jgi:hypothetical protein
MSSGWNRTGSYPSKNEIKNEQLSITNIMHGIDQFYVQENYQIEGGSAVVMSRFNNSLAFSGTIE